ncbi:MAG: HAD family hydrolase [Candidatus Bathyarchaeota archaeon]|nr:HAD family hydrolase [Candidatus Bathyarchaeota archaeon]
MPIKAVLFDMFDTLMLINKDHAFYSPAVKSMHQFLYDNGIPVTFAPFRDAYIKARDQLYEDADLKMEEPHFDMRVKNALKSLGYVKESESSLVHDATEVFCREFMRYVSIDEAAADALEKLHGTYRLGLVSNFAIPECVYKLLEQEQLDRFFDTIIVSAAVNKRKPNPDIFQLALERLGLTATETVFVGDTVDADVMGPQRVGMKTVYIERRPQKDLQHHNPDVTIKSLTELSEAIQKL